MARLNLTIEGKDGKRTVSFAVSRMVNAGYTSRDQRALRRHIDELRQKGIPAPSSIPTLYPVASYLILTGGTVEVVDERNSGEAEFVLLVKGKELLVAVGSDHTDRNLESTSIIKAKQMCPNVMSPTVWRFEELEDHWDELILRSWVTKDGKRILYQEGKVSELMSPHDLLSFVKSKLVDECMENLVIFSGTIPTIGGEIISGERFEAQLYDPVADRSLWCKYDVKMLDFLTI